MIALAVYSLFWLLGFVVIWRIKFLPQGLLGDIETVSVIIPARNESQRLPALLDTLRNQSHTPLEVLVVDDHSTDETATLAKKGGARVIASEPLPAGWRGKTWACHQGGQAARGKWLLFLDSDVTLRSNAVQQILMSCRTLQGVVSVLPYHNTVRAVEDLSAFFNLVQAAASNSFTALGDRIKNKRLFGPVMAVSKEQFERVGGYEPVKDRWVENFDLSEHFQSAQIPMACYGGKGSVEFRMYSGGVKDIAQGWGKSFAMGGKGTPKGVLLLWGLWFAGSLGTVRILIGAVIQGDSGVLISAMVLYGLYVWRIHSGLKQVGTFRFMTSLLHPAPALFFVGVFFQSVVSLWLGRSLTWKGRTHQEAR
jgi:4,4'-diaponeurosporenoate glycosyltransferase